MTPILPDAVQELIGKACAPIDQARAQYLGLSLVGHRRSASVGEMLWALPGRGCLSSDDLAASDPKFRVITEPSPVTLSLVYQTLHALGETRV